MKIAFRDRVAMQYLVFTAILMAIIFGAIFFTVKAEVYRQMDISLTKEGAKHLSEIAAKGDSIYFTSKLELLEREHQDVEVSPVFLQITDNSGHVEDKSPNLKDFTLPMSGDIILGEGYSARFKGLPIRVMTLPISKNKNQAGYLLTAKPIEGSLAVLLKLKQMLWVIYPVLLILLFFNSRFLAGRSIKPIQNISAAAKTITRNNLNARVPVPVSKDEIHTLASTINDLLSRLQKAFVREKQFTSDASHELRTPLTALRGTLEVLIRKPREQYQYKEKIEVALKEINRLDKLVEQLLALARAQSNQAVEDTMPLGQIISRCLNRHQSELKEKQIQVELKMTPVKSEPLPLYLGELIFDNVLSNAVKYTPHKGWIKIDIQKVPQGLECVIRDSGEGFNTEDQGRLTQPFYRATDKANARVEGTGLGLAIAEKAAIALNGTIKLISEEGQGTTVRIILRKS